MDVSIHNALLDQTLQQDGAGWQSQSLFLVTGNQPEFFGPACFLVLLMRSKCSSKPSALIYLSNYFLQCHIY